MQDVIRKKIGILGGMGPEATAHMFGLIVKMTKASRDQDHITSIVYNYPQVPDRTAAILGKGPSPLPFLIEGARALEKAGADFILMPCVTAHYYYPELVKHISIPFLHLLHEVLRHVKQVIPSARKFLLLATSGTVKTGMFQELFSENGLVILTPSQKQQELTMKALYHEKGVKGGFKRLPRKMILDVLEEIMEKHRPDGVIAGCTELPLVLSQADMAVPFVNPLHILAEVAIRKAGGQPRKLRLRRKANTGNRK